MTEWRTHTPQYDGHAPDDWDGEMAQFLSFHGNWYSSQLPSWDKKTTYRYHSKAPQGATHEPDLLAQCLALPQADRDALIEALQKPRRDWADDVWEKACHAYGLLNSCPERAQAAAVIRTMCRPKEEN